MTNQSALLVLMTVVGISIGAFYTVHASDAELTSDFFVPQGTNISTLDARYFTFSGFRNGTTPATGKQFAVTKAFSAGVPALTGLGVASAQLDYLPGGINPPHTHPRATEILFVCAGSLEVGFIDSANKLYNQTLQTGDLFVFPKGLVHYEVNNDAKVEAKAISSFSSSSPGLISLPPTLFGSSIPDDILAKSLAVTSDVVTKLQEPFIQFHTL